MAIEFKLTLESIDANCEESTLRDDTTYGNGEAERSELAVYVRGVKKNNNSDDTDVEVTPLDPDPFAVDRWTFNADSDGWYVFPQYGVYVWDSATAYVTDDAVYKNGTLYKALRASVNADPETSGSDWVAVSDLKEIDDSGNIEYGLNDITISCRSEKCYAEVTSEAAKEVCNNTSDTLFGKLYREVDVLLQGANVKCQQEKYAEYEDIIRALENVCKDYGPCSNC